VARLANRVALAGPGTGPCHYGVATMARACDPGAVERASIAPEALFRRIVEGMPEAVVYADRDGVIRLWNHGAETVFGYSASEAVGRTLDLIIPERWRARHWEGYREVMRTGVTRYGAQLLAVPATRKDGARISIEFSIALLEERDAGVLGAVAVVRDVTARREQEQALRKRIAEIESRPGSGEPR
jgi:PAS domain S-box-containing protein